jgi:uncharacterized Zn-finger protein
MCGFFQLPGITTLINSETVGISTGMCSLTTGASMARIQAKSLICSGLETQNTFPHVFANITWKNIIFFLVNRTFLSGFNFAMLLTSESFDPLYSHIDPLCPMERYSS